VSGADFSITFDKATGLIREAKRLGRRILGEGPLLNVATSDEVSFLSRAPIQETLAEPFVPGSVKVESNPESVRILSAGKVGERSVAYETTIHGNGIMTIDFTLTQAKTLPCQEVGLAFTLAEGFDSVSWRRKSGLWTSYPDDHIGRLTGRASLFAPDIATPYRQRPVVPWAMDSRDYFLYGPNQSGVSLTRDAKSCRAFIGSYVVIGEDLQVAVLGTGREGARIRELGGGKLALVVNTDWDYINLGWGNYERGLKLPPEYTGRIKLDLGHGRDPAQP
jgi:hypothetical protein